MTLSSQASQVEKHFSDSGLPVADCLPELCSHLSHSPLVALKAPPGSGKTVLAPVALREQLSFRQVLVLEPRRVTARLPALALRQVLGELVGYRIRLESRWNPQLTKVGYLTYGTALRMFADTLPDSEQLIVFDEFHERTWEAELLLALLRSRQGGPKILLMSATLDLDSLPPGTPVVESDGRLHSVNISWEKVEPQLAGRADRLAGLIAERSAEFFVKERGEQLIFLPGMREIRAAEEKLRADHLPGDVDILHSSLPEDEIRRVVSRSSECGFRRILSTDLAESSVTLPGITTVIDAGLSRRPLRDELRLGVTLRTEPAPRSALEQRAGRAGRVKSGFCHRLFTRRSELHRDPFPVSELEQADYRSIVLFLASLTLLKGAEGLPWLSSPAAPRLLVAKEWCQRHRLLSLSGELLAKGKQVMALPLGPQIALFAVNAIEAGLPSSRVVEICQALESPPSGRESLSLEQWLRQRRKEKLQNRRLAEQLHSKLQSVPLGETRDLPSVLLSSYSGTVAQFSSDRAVPATTEQAALFFAPSERPQETFGVLLGSRPHSSLQGPRSAVSLFAELSIDLLWEEMLEEFEESSTLLYQEEQRQVRQLTELRLGRLVLESSTQAPTPNGSTATLLASKVRLEELGEVFLNLVHRLRLYLSHKPERGEGLQETLGQLPDPERLEIQFLESFLQDRLQWTKSCARELHQHTLGLLPYSLSQELDRELPAQIQLPGRRRPVPVHYPPDQEPYIESKLQDFFAWKQPPLLGGKLNLVCRLLAPNGRPCQITTDLESFWRGSYQQVRKDLRGRYPKHPWPEDPLS